MVFRGSSKMNYNLQMNSVNPINHSTQQECHLIFRLQLHHRLLSFLALQTPLQSLTNSAAPYQKLLELAKPSDATLILKFILRIFTKKKHTYTVNKTVK
jgi:hypothetical protein